MTTTTVGTTPETNHPPAYSKRAGLEAIRGLLAFVQHGKITKDVLLSQWWLPDRNYDDVLVQNGGNLINSLFTTPTSTPDNDNDNNSNNTSSHAPIPEQDVIAIRNDFSQLQKAPPVPFDTLEDGLKRVVAALNKKGLHVNLQQEQEQAAIQILQENFDV